MSAVGQVLNHVAALLPGQICVVQLDSRCRKKACSAGSVDKHELKPYSIIIPGIN